MNRLKTTGNGGWPLELDDLRWAEQSVRDTFYGLLSAFGIAPVDSFIISGCVVTGSTCSAGYISLNGEILKYPGGTVPTPSGGQSVYWKVVTSYDSSGLEQFEDGSSQDTYEIRGADLEAVTTDATRMPLAALTLIDKIHSDKKWHLFGGSGEPTFQNSWGAGSVAPGYMKTNDGFVHLKGIFLSADNTNHNTIVTLPVGYRPLETRAFAVPNGNGFGGVIFVVVDSGGNVNIGGPTPWFTGATVVGVFLDGINFATF